MRPNKNAIEVQDTITPFTVNFYKGDDEIIKYEIKVYKLEMIFLLTILRRSIIMERKQIVYGQ